MPWAAPRVRGPRGALRGPLGALRGVGSEGAAHGAPAPGSSRCSQTARLAQRGQGQLLR